MQRPQASQDGTGYVAFMDRSFIRAMAYAARQARREAGLKQVRVAAFLDVDQSTIARFERGRGWPEDLGKTLLAYEAAGTKSALEIGRVALELWASPESLADEIEEFLEDPLGGGTPNNNGRASTAKDSR